MSDLALIIVWGLVTSANLIGSFLLTINFWKRKNELQGFAKWNFIGTVTIGWLLVPFSFYLLFMFITHFES